MSAQTNFLFTTNNISKLQEFFDKNPTIDISKLRDQKRNTLLHQAVFQNNLPVVKLFLDHIKKIFEKQYWNNTNTYKKPIKQSIQALLNQGNNEGFTCLHYASYKGNVEMIKFLESLGANSLLLTKLGLNCLHLAAQGDQIASALYFYDKFDINAFDNKKGTALHWAAYIGSDEVTSFLLAQDEIQLNCFDAQDQTPLHLAVLYGNTSIVKKLLIKGADKTLSNGKGQKPIDIAENNEFQRIFTILNSNFTLSDKLKFYCNVRIKYQPQQRNFLRVLSFLILFLIGIVSTHLFIIPNFQEVIIYIGIGFNSLLLLVYFALLFQPTIPPQKTYKQLITSLPICSECKIPKLPRMHHCDICKKCISQYDHHCPWINGCVGKHNIKLFPLFLGMLIISFLQTGFLCVIGILDLDNFVKSYRYVENRIFIQIIYKIVFGFVLLTIIVFICPICYLFYVQTCNILYGKTTFERFGGSKKKPKQDDSSTNQNSLQHRLLNESDDEEQKCSLKNCNTMCCVDNKVYILNQ